MYARYVDDIVMALNVINKGWLYNKKKNVLQFSKELLENDNRDKERRTAETIVEIANSINNNIQLTWDSPLQNNNGRMPVLDLAIWVDEIEGRQVILHTFYKKKVASKFTMLKRSALSIKIKRNTLLQEALRRLGNISRELPWDETVSHLSEYSNMLRISGYNQWERYHNIVGAINRHRQMTKEVSEGNRESLFRTRKDIMKTKDDKGGLSAATWFLSGETRSVISCQATPDVKLAEMIREKIGKASNGDRRLVTEEGGVPVTLGLKVIDTHKKQGCQYNDKDCWVEDGKCSEMGALYCITCKTCNQNIDPSTNEKHSHPGGVKAPNYIGMTASSLHARHTDHRRGHKARNKNNCLVKHEVDVHDGQAQEYTAKYIGRERGLLHLSLKEALLIENQVQGTSLNDRKEHGRSTGCIRINTGIT